MISAFFIWLSDREVQEVVGGLRKQNRSEKEGHVLIFQHFAFAFAEI